MKKEFEIINIVNNLESSDQEVDLDSIEKIIREKNQKISRGYISNILLKRKKIEMKIECEKLKVEKIIEIAKAMELMGNGISIKEIKKIANKNHINFGMVKIKHILADGGLTSRNDKFAERRKEMAELTHKGWTMQMIADKYGITKQAVSLLLKKASKKDGVVVVKGALGRNPKNGGENCILVKRRKKLDEFIECAVCKKKILNNGKRKTCSKECCKKILRTGGKWSRHEFVELTCKNCNKTFMRSNYIHSITSVKKKTNNCYCSRKCYLEKLSAE